MSRVREQTKHQRVMSPMLRQESTTTSGLRPTYENFLKKIFAWLGEKEVENHVIILIALESIVLTALVVMNVR